MVKIVELTDVTFFDTDCLSSFLLVGRESIILQIFEGKIKIPQVVIDELKDAEVLYNKLDIYIKRGKVEIVDIDFGGEAFELYEEFTSDPKDGYKIIGKGEAAVLALAKVYNGVVASNNLKDVVHYIKKYRLKYITAGEILREALARTLIDEKTGNKIWNDMKKKGRILPNKTFSEYLKSEFVIK